MTDKTIFLVSLALCIFSLAYISNDMYSYESEKEARYCQMVSAWHATDGEIGWPDYNGNYNEVCE